MTARRLAGFRAWVWQRATAVYIGLFLVYLLGRMAVAPFDSAEALRAWLGGTTLWVAFGLFALALLLHAWIGVRDVILDYVKPPALRLALLAAVALFLLANGLWLAGILMEVR